MTNVNRARFATILVLSTLFGLHLQARPAMAQVATPGFLFAFGSEGSANGQFFWGTFIGSPFTANLAVDRDRELFVVDCTIAFDAAPEGSRVQKFDADGNFLGKFADNGELFGGNACYVTVGPSGRVYVAEELDREVDVFDNDGTWLFKWGGHGFGDGEFIGIRGIASDAQGDIYVLNTVPSTIKKFDPDGNFLARIPLAEDPESAGSLLALGSNGVDEIYAAFILTIPDTFEGGVVRTFDPSGAIVSTLFFNERPFAVQGVTGDADGNVYVTEGFGKHRVSKFDSNGNLRGQWGMMGSAAGEFNNPAGVAINANGRIYVADTGNKRVQVFAFPPPEVQIDRLIQDVQAIGLPGRAGEAQLNAALGALAQEPPDIQGAITALQDFINYVNAQRGKKIPLQTAHELIAAAQALIDELSQ